MIRRHGLHPCDHVPRLRSPGRSCNVCSSTVASLVSPLSATTDGSGVYAIDGVPAGPFSVTAEDPVRGVFGTASGQIVVDGDVAATDYGESCAELVQRLHRDLTSYTEGAYVYRVDFRLRPYGGYAWRDGESYLGRHSQSMLPSFETSAAVRQLVSRA